MPEQAREILRQSARLAIVGVAKNCGKTTTLNALLRSARAANVRVGLVSVGVDGESSDALIGTPKPTITFRRGEWAVSAAGALAQSSARVEYVQSLGFTTPLGPVSLVRALEDGELMLAGMRHQQDLRDALELMQAHGASCCLIDGAYGRVVAARADLCDGVIVATGAALGSTIEAIVAGTCALTSRLTLPRATLPWQRALLDEALATSRALLGGQQAQATPLEAASALLGLARAPWTPALTAIAIPGLVSDRVVESLLSAPALSEPRALLLSDGTALQASASLTRRLLARWQVLAREVAPLRAISVNPTHVLGDRVDSAALRAALSQAHPGVWIFDPMQPE